MHLAQKLKRARQDRRRGRRAHRRARQDRHRRRRLGHRLRRRAQQLLPAGDARADGALRRRSGKATRRPTAITRSATCRSAPRSMRAQVGTIYEQQKAIGYESTFIEGEADSLRYMQGLLHDWQAKNITSVLHEKRGGYANNQASLRRPRAQGARRWASRSSTGVAVTGFRSDGGSRRGHARSRPTPERSPATRSSSPSARGSIRSGTCSRCRSTITVKGRDGTTHDGVRMWHYMALQEGTLGVDPDFQKTNDGAMPPVIHVDTDAPLYSDRDGKLITDQLWGLYYKPDFHFGGVQGGAMPATVERDADEVRVDPYGPKSPEFVVDDNFADMWTSALAYLPEALRRQARRVPQRAVGRHRLLHARQLSGVRPVPRERLRDRRFESRLQDDRRRQAGRRRVARRQARVARAVPVFALRRRQAASGEPTVPFPWS